MAPRVFVGSASEAEEIDKEVRRILVELGAAPLGWRDFFKPGDFALDALMGLVSAVDGALLIVTPDDPTDFRGTARKSPRDNILFELGLFISHFGTRRTGIVHVITPTESAALPSDLLGFTTVIFQPGNAEHNTRQLSRWLQGINEEIERDHPALPRLFEMLRNTFKAVPISGRDAFDRYVVESFMMTLRFASRGEILLTPIQYYQAINDELDSAAAPCEVLGIATLSSTFWSEDRDQRTYMIKNAEAVRRGADIKRLFIVPDAEWEKLSDVVRQQLHDGIHIRRAKPAILAAETRLEDMVMFIHRPSRTSRVYITDPAFDNPTSIRRGRLILDEDDRDDFLKTFERVWAKASSVTVRDLMTNVSPRKDQRAPEPGPNLKVFTLDRPVVTCEEAAAAKGISLDNELKTLILTTQRGPVALHLLGDGEASLRAVKSAMETKEASLASPKTLKDLGLQPGTVCAVKDPVWSMPHLITRRVLSKDMVSTNNGTHRGFYRFDPNRLLDADSVMIGDFERGPNDTNEGAGREPLLPVTPK